MKLLLSYLKQYWKLVVLALFLAAVNQIFSLLDPFIFRHVIDEYATRYQEYTTAQFFKGVSLLLAAAPAGRSRAVLGLIVALAAAPVAASYLLYYFWPPARTVNYGELIEPRPLPDVPLDRKSVV